MKTRPTYWDSLPLQHLTVYLVTMTIFLLAAGTVNAANTYWVSPTGSNSNNGLSSGSPFQTIAHAMSVCNTSDTINLMNGTYNETVTFSHGGASGAPFTLQAASGATPVISQFQTIPSSAWTTDFGSAYKTTVSFSALDLFVSETPVPLAQSAGGNAVSNTYAGGVYTMVIPSIGKTSWGSDVRSSFIFAFSHVTNDYYAWYITSMTDDGTNCTLTYTGNSDYSNIVAGDPVWVCNHKSLLTSGTFDYQNLGSTTLLEYWPQSTSNLNYTQSREKLNVNADGIYINNLSYINITGLTVAGALNEGIYATGSNYLTISNCTIWGNGGKNGGGIQVLTSSNDTVQNCLLSGNTNGIDFNNINTGLIQQCEDGFDQTDGIDIGGTSSNVTVNECYIHNHIGLNHCDCVQVENGGTYSNIQVNKSVLAYSGQAIISQGSGTSMSATDDIAFGQTARPLPLYVPWTLTNDTVAFGYVDAGTNAANNTILNSIFYGVVLPYNTQPSSNYNLFWNNSPAARGSCKNYVAIKGGSKYTTDNVTNHTIPGYEANSSAGDPAFVTEPLSIVGQFSYSGSLSTITIDIQGNCFAPTGTYFQKNDVVEVNGDGIAHTITNATVGTGNTYVTVTLNPPLSPAEGNYGGLVMDWPATPSSIVANLSLTSTSPGLSGAYPSGQRGSRINMSQFLLGEFDGSGTLNRPQVPTAMTNFWSTPQLYPCYGF